ncbi:mannose-1-phosphate guanylyltransferase/mannose-6-phosphate isomerase [Microbaculum marinisediminis]|uniref:mannose-1-phosphate guanylyltransferase n=1 Tax=Microbaculum marinisediminis TaxID=2931392 RepID=A0AAW5QVE7_9HYPH|nr:mannose-1-phosphate guanylyltransferase/mannose-6-phosphate isomerase [Microbaculum sp. A6E488]MCT8970516.1 mannose-1-phosphate guanylyltransferase/mannose-6-phosphate isomerase [Microbaculum sp. A6E488]
MTDLVHAIMCGGAGTRLWPWSRSSCPKPFLTLAGDRSLLQSTVDRLDGFSMAVETIVLGNRDDRVAIAEHLRDTSGAAEIVLEPEIRDTAPAALVAALRAQARLSPGGLVLLAPADHVIADTGAFHAAITRAMPAARAGYVVTFGIGPTHPATRYGYIEYADADAPAGGDGVFRVRSFREKPDEATAEAFVASGNFLWNAGIFLFDPAALLDQAETLHPEMVATCRAACDKASRDIDFLRLDPEAYARLGTISFDHAFAERLGDRLAVVPVSMGWSDIGSWTALYEARSEQAEAGNVIEGPVDLVDCSGSLAFSDGPALVARGLRDMVVAASHGAVFVAPRAEADKVKDIVATLADAGKNDIAPHDRVIKHWGWYRVIGRGDGFQVKEIVVNPGERLSLQSHRHRAEHWIVVHGTARATLDGACRTLPANTCIHIPAGARHRLENPGEAPVHIIEIQTGAYLEEDDIVRHAENDEPD